MLADRRLIYASGLQRGFTYDAASQTGSIIDTDLARGTFVYDAVGNRTVVRVGKLLPLIQSLKIGLFALSQATGYPKEHFMKKYKTLSHLLFFVWVTILTGCNYYGPRHEPMNIAFNARGIENLFSIGDKKSDVMVLNVEKVEINNGEYEAVHFLENHVAVFFHEDKIIRIKIAFHDDNCMFVYKTKNHSIIFSSNIDYDRFFEVNKDVFYPVNSLGDGAYTNREHTLLIDFQHGRISSVEIHGVTDYSKEIYTNVLPK